MRNVECNDSGKCLSLTSEHVGQPPCCVSGVLVEVTAKEGRNQNSSVELDKFGNSAKI